MSEFTPIQASFNGGEISPRMQSRVDQDVYAISTAEMLNFVPTIEGPAMKRSGFRHIRAADGTAAWLSSFTFSVDQAYILEWADLSVRFYTNGGRIESSPTVPYALTVPYLASEAPFVSSQQSYDRLYLAHGNYPPAALTRLTATTFSYGALTLKNGPFSDRNTDELRTVTVSATTGSITVFSAYPIFLPGHVGGPFMIEAMGFSSIKSWEPNVRTDTMVVGDLRRSDGKVYQLADKAASIYTGSIQPTHTRGAEWDGSGNSLQGFDPGLGIAGVQWKYLYDAFGVGVISAVATPYSATMTVTRTLADSLTGTAPSFRWSLPAFSAATGWPKHVILAFGRLIFFDDFTMSASVVGDYGGGTVNMAPFTDSGLFAPDMGFRRRLDFSNPILWVKADRDVILVGTADGIFAIRKINSGQTFSSDNIEVVKQTHFGVAPCRPAQAGNSTIVVQRGGRKLREANYSLDSDRYTAPNITIWQRHILRSGAKQLAFQGEPEELLWVVRADGTLALHPHVPEQEIRGFARITHGDGPILSACAIHGSTGQDELWVLVNGGGGRSVQLQAPPWEEGEVALRDAFFVDSGATYSGAPTTTISGLSHLNGRAVAVLADGAVLTGLAIAGGTLTLPRAASRVQIGIGFTARLTGLRVELRGANGGTVQGKRQRLVNFILRLIDTGGVKIDAGFGRSDEMIDRPTTGPMNSAVPMYSGDTKKPIGGPWGVDSRASVISDEPLPCMVQAFLPRFEVSDR